jgi:hypothetical protein
MPRRAIRDDPADLYNRLADAGLTGGLTASGWRRTLEAVAADRRQAEPSAGKTTTKRTTKRARSEER